MPTCRAQQKMYLHQKRLTVIEPNYLRLSGFPHITELITYSTVKYFNKNKMQYLIEYLRLKIEHRKPHSFLIFP